MMQMAEQRLKLWQAWCSGQQPSAHFRIDRDIQYALGYGSRAQLPCLMQIVALSILIRNIVPAGRIRNCPSTQSDDSCTKNAGVLTSLEYF